jgi:hypothetical protein
MIVNVLPKSIRALSEPVMAPHPHLRPNRSNCSQLQLLSMNTAKAFLHFTSYRIIVLIGHEA